MISISRARRLLGKAGEKLTEEETEMMLSQCYALMEIMFEHFKPIERIKEVKKKNDKFKTSI